MIDVERTVALRTIRDEIFNLTDSPLYEYRTANKYFPVIGEGNHEAAIMLIGEAPGQSEAKTGRPFAGRAGAVLDELLNSAGLPRSSIYITNVVKDRPPENRDPLPAEIACYGPFLDRQIAIIQPRIIGTLGRYAMKYILETFNLLSYYQPISRLHGQVLGGEASYGPIKVVPLYHPAVAVYDASMKTVLVKDFQILKTL